MERNANAMREIARRDDRWTPKRRPSAFLASCSQTQWSSRYAARVQAAITGLLVGAVHAFLLSLALLTKGKNAHASRYLAALVLSLGVLLLSSSAPVAGYMRAHPHLINRFLTRDVDRFCPTICKARHRL